MNEDWQQAASPSRWSTGLWVNWNVGCWTDPSDRPIMNQCSGVLDREPLSTRSLHIPLWPRNSWWLVCSQKLGRLWFFKNLLRTSLNSQCPIPLGFWLLHNTADVLCLASKNNLFRLIWISWKVSGVNVKEIFYGTIELVSYNVRCPLPCAPDRVNCFVILFIFFLSSARPSYKLQILLWNLTAVIYSQTDPELHSKWLFSDLLHCCCVFPASLKSQAAIVHEEHFELIHLLTL